MQNMFAGDTEWHTSWMERVLPNVERIVRRNPARTLFTRFVSARDAASAPGTWRRYYERWHAMTLAELDPAMVELMPALAGFVPPALVFDKTTYAPWIHGDLDARLRRRGIDTLVVTGGETDVCVLGTVLGAVDRGYRDRRGGRRALLGVGRDPRRHGAALHEPLRPAGRDGADRRGAGVLALSPAGAIAAGRHPA